MKTVRRSSPIYTFLLVLTILGIPSLAAAQNAAVQHLLELLSRWDPASSDTPEEFTHATIEAGPAAIPALREVVERHENDMQRDLGLAALGFIGGSAAVSLLKREYDEGDTRLEGLLAFAFASMDSPENRSILIRILEADPTSESRPLIQEAAWSLGILRATEAIDSLRMVAQRRPIFADSSAARDALRWIEKGFWRVATERLTEQERAVAAVLRNGIPGISEGWFYIDSEQKGFWILGTSGWTFDQTKPEGEASGMISFDTFISSDGTRALVSVGLHCGMLCGFGYDYLLRRDETDWKVQALISTWVS